MNRVWRLNRSHWPRVGAIIFATVAATLMAVLILNWRSRADLARYDLAFVGIYGEVRVSSADGRRQKKLLNDSRCPNATSLDWSPAGDHLACSGPVDRDNLNSDSVLVVTDMAGQIVVDLKSVTNFAWSPLGRRMVYGLGLDLGKPTKFHVADAQGRLLEQFDGLSWGTDWSPDESALAYTDRSGDLVILDMKTKSRQRLGPGTILAWVRNDLMLIATNRRVADIGEYDIYTAYVLDLRNRKRTRFELLDDNTQFWVSPYLKSPFIVVYVREDADQLSIVDLASLRVNRVKGTRINTAGSFHVVRNETLVFSSDGLRMFWTDVGRESPTAIYGLQADGTGLTKIGTLPPSDVRLSLDLSRVAYVTSDEKPTLWTALLDGTQARRVGRFYPDAGFGDFSWRPTRQR